MFQSCLNRHLTSIAKIWTVTPVIKIITWMFPPEDVLVLQGPSSCCHWEQYKELQIMGKIQRLMRSFLDISTDFRLEHEETGYLPTTGSNIDFCTWINLYSILYCLDKDFSCFNLFLFLQQLVEITPQRSPQKQRGAKRKLAMTEVIWNVLNFIL